MVPPRQAAGSSVERWIASCLEYLRTECRLAGNTIAAYTRDLRRLHEWLAGRSPVHLAVRDLTDYVAWLHEKKLAPASVSRHMAR